MDPNGQVAIVILAAGTSSRTGVANKLLLPCGSSTLLGRVASRAARRSHLTVIVTGHESDAIARAVSDYSVSTSFNPAYAEGMASSIVCGIRSAGEADFFMIWPGDMPLITDDTLERLLASAQPGRIAVPRFEHRRGHPVIFSRFFRERLLKLSGDSGARVVLEEHPDRVDEIVVQDGGILFDVDTADAYEELLRRLPPGL